MRLSYKEEQENWRNRSLIQLVSYLTSDADRMWKQFFAPWHDNGISTWRVFLFWSVCSTTTTSSTLRRMRSPRTVSNYAGFILPVDGHPSVDYSLRTIEIKQMEWSSTTKDPNYTTLGYNTTILCKGGLRRIRQCEMIIQRILTTKNRDAATSITVHQRT